MTTPEPQTKNIVVWELESTHPELVDPLKASLREVVDPEIGLEIIQLGLVRDAAIDDQKAIITMILTTPFCPYGPAMLEMTRQKAEKALAMPTTIKMGVEMWDFSYMEDGTGNDWGLYY